MGVGYVRQVFAGMHFSDLPVNVYVHEIQISAHDAGKRSNSKKLHKFLRGTLFLVSAFAGPDEPLSIAV